MRAQQSTKTVGLFALEYLDQLRETAMELLGVIHLIAWLYAVIRLLGSGAGAGEKILWIIIVLILPLLGLLLWFVLGPGSPFKKN